MDTSVEFKDFGLHDQLLGSLSQKGFEKASPIQELTIKPILEGKDIFAQAETGSGKTGSFAIPILEQILRANEEEGSTSGKYLVLSPTRELAQQTHKVFNDFGIPLDVLSACFIGGERIEKQKEILEKNPQILVATPGRLHDLVKNKHLNVEDCRCVVFDEADRLFDMGFQKDIDAILKNVPKSRQMIMVSATSNMEVLNTAYKHHSQPVELKLNADDLVVDNINHEIAMLSDNEKMPYLVNLLRKFPDAYAIVFCNTQYETHMIAEWLSAMKFNAKPISGRLNQGKRNKLMEEFKSKTITTLVCTDVAARGLDIKGVNLVVNYDLPNEAANYVHRIGRTGRAGTSGYAVSLCGYDDGENLDQIMELLDSKIPKADINDDEDFATDLCKRPYIDSKTLQLSERTDRKGRNNNNKDKPKRTKTTKDTGKMEKQTKAPQKIDRKAMLTFKTTSYSSDTSKLLAQKHFGIVATDLLEEKILESGKRKYFIFGPKLTTFEYSVKPIYKRLLLPFLIELFKKMQLRVYARVSFKHPYVRVNFSGQDAHLLTANKFELQNSIELVLKMALSKKIAIPADVKFSVRSETSDRNSKGSDKKGVNEKKLLGMAKDAEKKVLESNKSYKIKSLNPAQRRIIHQYINDTKSLKSDSIGEGRFKDIEISLK